MESLFVLLVVVVPREDNFNMEMECETREVGIDRAQLVRSVLRKIDIREARN